jgi:hypothetical protein
MTIENEAEQAANDTALLDDQTNEACAPDAVEVKYEGKTYQVPPELRDALLRQADYTRKTQEVAQSRKALTAEKAAHDQKVSWARAHMLDAARVVALNDQLAQFDQVDWRALQKQDPSRAQALLQVRARLKDMRDRAARAWTDKAKEHASHSQRTTARRMNEVSAHLPRLIADWSPELDAKLMQYGTAQGLSHPEMTQATLQNPAFVKLLHKAHLSDEAEKKKQTQQTFDAALAARPVTRVGGGGGTASRRTTDASGDALSAEEWAKRERERLRRR